MPYIVAPVISAFTALLAFSVIPFGPGWDIGGYTVKGEVADVPIALILVFALGSIGVYGFIVGGWASDSKYSLLGSMRTCAQLVSYEVSLSLSVLGVVLMGQSLSLVDIVAKQNSTIWFVIPQFVGFVVFFVAGVAETNRAPFDLPEADTELVAGYHTEYSGMRWGLFQMAEYVNMIVLSALAVTLFFGGWDGPWLPGPIWFLIKLALFVTLFIWIRATLPRLRYDQLMRFGWKVLLPVATLNAVITALVVVVDLRCPQPLRRFKGFAVTFRQLFNKPITQQYPEYKRPVYPRFRGRHRLHLHENGLEKCVGCSLCAAACPADCIRVVAGREHAPSTASPPASATRASTRSTSSRCIFCGYCELACPFDAITLGNEFEISEYSRDDLIYTKDMLLAEPIKQMPVAEPAAQYDTPIPYYKSRHSLECGNVIVWIVWVARGLLVPRLGDRRRQLLEPVLLGARADREPRLARRALPAALGRVRRRGAGARLRGRGDGDVPVRDRLPRRPRGRAVGGRAERAGDGRGRGGGGDPRRGDRRDRARGLGHPLARGEDLELVRQPGGDRPGSSSPTTCSRSRSPRSCCSSRRSAASSSAATHGPAATWGSESR